MLGVWQTSSSNAFAQADASVVFHQWAALSTRAGSAAVVPFAARGRVGRPRPGGPHGPGDDRPSCGLSRPPPRSPQSPPGWDAPLQPADPPEGGLSQARFPVFKYIVLDVGYFPPAPPETDLLPQRLNTIGVTSPLALLSLSLTQGPARKLTGIFYRIKSHQPSLWPARLIPFKHWLHDWTYWR